MTDIKAQIRETDTDLTAEASDSERFNSIKDRLIAATGSPGLTSFRDGKVHMPLSEWDRLVTITTEVSALREVIEKARKELIDATQTSEMRNRNAFGVLESAPAVASPETKGDN